MLNPFLEDLGEELTIGHRINAAGRHGSALLAIEQPLAGRRPPSRLSNWKILVVHPLDDGDELQVLSP